MIYLWWALGIAGYAAVGSFTYGRFMRLAGDLDAFDEASAALFAFGALIWPVVYVVAGVVGAIGAVAFLIYKLLELIGFIRLLQWLVRLGRGGDAT